MSIYGQIKAYIPVNEQERADKAIILSQLESNKNVFNRTSLTAHMTVSAWVVNGERNKVLMAYHNLYKSWAWLGGHADGKENLLSVAVKEAKEESGLDTVQPVSPDIASIEVLTVDGHIKNGRYVPSHLHLNVTYILEADETQSIKPKCDENSAVAWIGFDDIKRKSSERYFVDSIYPKLIKRSSEIEFVKERV